jgi:hypothetical protein
MRKSTLLQLLVCLIVVAVAPIAPASTDPVSDAAEWDRIRLVQNAHLNSIRSLSADYTIRSWFGPPPSKLRTATGSFAFDGGLIL